MAVITGNSSNNTLNGDATADFINGLGGNDTLYGNGGSDILIGGTGIDKLYGGSGDDVFQVGSGEAADGEVYSGGTGVDTLRITTLAPSIDFMYADFKAAALSSIEVLSFTGAGTINAFFDADSIGPGLSASLSLQGSSSLSLVDITMDKSFALNLSGWDVSNWAGVIKIHDTAEVHDITGTAARDDIFVGANDDTVHAGAGDDRIEFSGTSAAPALIDGGSGTDTLVVNDNVDVDLRNASVSGIEAISFEGGMYSIGQISLKASQFGSSGLASNLVIENAVDHPTVNIDLGLLTSFSAAQFQITSPTAHVQINGGSAADIITGSVGGDYLHGNGGNDVLRGGAGRDVLYGDAGTDTMRGGADGDMYIVDNAGDVAQEVINGVDAGGLDDTVQSTVSFTLAAGIEDLVLKGTSAIDGTGNSSDNHIWGNDFVNVINGGGGDDMLIGGQGQDTLTGGAGADVFRYVDILDSQSGPLNRDIITDFKVGVDKIQLAGVDAIMGNGTYDHFVQDTNGIFEAGEFRISHSNGNTVISVNIDSNTTPEMQILLQNVTGVTAADFIL